MNEDIIMHMVKPYVNNGVISFTKINELFGDFLSEKEINEIVNLLPKKGIAVINEITEEQKFFNMAKPFVRSGYMSYENFDKVFRMYPRRKQYEIVEILFALGVELIDEEILPLDIATSSIEDLSDPLNMTEDERNPYSTDILYDRSVFEDDVSSHAPVFSNITQKNETLCKLIQDGNIQAMQDICIKNKNLVSKYACAYQGYYGNDLSIDDLTQAGYIGLLQAARKYDFTSDNAFSTYATYWIKQSITREIADTGYTIRMPVHMIEKIIKITKLDEKYDMCGFDYDARIKQIAFDLQLSEEQVLQAISVRKKYMRLSSLNALTGEGTDTELGELIVDTESENVEDVVMTNICSAEVEQMLYSLSNKEREVIRYRFGLYDGKEWSLEEVAKVYHLTRERIRQIECKALRRLRHPTKGLLKWY